MVVCALQGINDEAMTPIRLSFSVTVEGDPYWVQKPESVDAAEGESATFYCEGESVPSPSYFWFLNGVPITKVGYVFLYEYFWTV